MVNRLRPFLIKYKPACSGSNPEYEITGIIKLIIAFRELLSKLNVPKRYTFPVFLYILLLVNSYFTIRKKPKTLLFFLLINLSLSVFAEETLTDSFWIMDNQRYESGINQVVLNLKSRGEAVWYYLFYPESDTDFSWRIRKEEWYPIQNKQIIVQDYMGEFVVLQQEEENLKIKSPVEGFEGIFSPYSEEQFLEEYAWRISDSP